MIVLVLILPACLYAYTPLSAQSDGSDSSSSASQDYQEFQSCLSGAETDGYATEQQIRDCFAPIYNTGTATTGPTSSDTPSGSEDASGPSSGSEDDSDNGGGDGSNGDESS